MFQISCFLSVSSLENSYTRVLHNGFANVAMKLKVFFFGEFIHSLHSNARSLFLLFWINKNLNLKDQILFSNIKFKIISHQVISQLK